MFTIAWVLVLLVYSNSRRSDPGNHFVDPRDNSRYELIELGGLLWFRENLKFRADTLKDTLINADNCGIFYPVDLAKNVCPEGWRLPKEKEVKKLINCDKKGVFSLIDTLDIELCGRIDDDTHSKYGLQNTFWLDEKLEDGYITHWHTFTDEHKVHNHNVVNVGRKFPVRCVCEIQERP